MSGQFSDGITIDAREIAAKLGIGTQAAKAALAELIGKGFLANLTPELPLDNAVFRLTMYPFQGQPATHDYLTPKERSRIEAQRAKRRRAGGVK